MNGLLFLLYKLHHACTWGNLDIACLHYLDRSRVIIIMFSWVAISYCRWYVPVYQSPNLPKKLPTQPPYPFTFLLDYPRMHACNTHTWEWIHFRIYKAMSLFDSCVIPSSSSSCTKYDTYLNYTNDIDLIQLEISAMNYIDTRVTNQYCRNYLKTALCVTIYPPCDGGIQTLCSEECDSLLNSGTCSA